MAAPSVLVKSRLAGSATRPTESVPLWSERSRSPVVRLPAEHAAVSVNATRAPMITERRGILPIAYLLWVCPACRGVTRAVTQIMPGRPPIW